MKIKGFDKNLCCRGMQFEIGKTYDTGAKDDEIRLCSDTVFHYCDSIQKVHNYYSCAPDSQNRFCEIEVLGAEISDESKSGTNKINIIREITGDELSTLLGLNNGNAGIFNSGNFNSGDYNSGNFNSGYRNSGDYNSGYRNSGYRNSGDYNSGYRNSGDYNSGNFNSGDYNSGYYNSGDYNSGDWNSCDGSDGVFCNEPDRNIRIFNQPSGMSLQNFRESLYCKALLSKPLVLAWWDEKTNTLKSRSYKEACAIWWDSLTDENKEIIQQIPNFDADVFFDITGIRVGED